MSFFDTTPIGRSMKQGNNCCFFLPFMVFLSRYHPIFLEPLCIDLQKASTILDDLF